MPKFFDTLDNLCRFLSQINQEKCPTCQNTNLLVPHSWVYKYSSSHQRHIVGKRLWCSPRYQRGGCGASHRLYLRFALPGLCYLAAQLTIFVTAFLTTRSVPKAYQQATGATESRNGYRWLARIKFRVSDYRTALVKPTTLTTSFSGAQFPQYQVVLETLSQLKGELGKNICEAFQLRFQKSFF